MRFVNLKNENKKLKERKTMINDEMERVAALERETLVKMKKELFEKQKKVSSLQGNITNIAGMNAELEQEFETEINKHNNDQRQAG